MCLPGFNVVVRSWVTELDKLVLIKLSFGHKSTSASIKTVIVPCICRQLLCKRGVQLAGSLQGRPF